MRLTIVSPPIVPVDLKRFIGSGRLARASAFGASSPSAADRFAPARLLRACELRDVGGGEVDRIEQQRREAGVGDGFGDDLPGEREDQARRFDQQERRQRFVGDAAEPEQPGVAQVDDEMDAIVRPRRDFDLQRDFVDIVGGLVRR